MLISVKYRNIAFEAKITGFTNAALLHYRNHYLLFLKEMNIFKDLNGNNVGCCNFLKLDNNTN